MLIGQGLHALQDIDAHMNAGKYDMFMTSVHATGDWQAYPNANYYDNTLIDYRYSKDLNRNIWLQCQSKWDNLRFVSSYNRSLDYLNEIIRALENSGNRC